MSYQYQYGDAINRVSTIKRIIVIHMANPIPVPFP
jgi:hypothetical protein